MAGASTSLQSGVLDFFADGAYDPAIADAVNQLEAHAGIAPPTTAVPTPLAQTIDDWAVTTTLTQTSGTAQVTLIQLVKGAVINKINLNSGAVSSTQTHCWAAITDASSTVKGTVLAVTSDLGTTATASSAVQALTLTSAWTVPTSGNYYVHTLCAASTVATFDAFAATAGVRGTQFPIIAGTGGTGLTTPPAVGATLSTALTVTKGIYAVLN